MLTSVIRTLNESVMKVLSSVISAELYSLSSYAFYFVCISFDKLLSPRRNYGLGRHCAAT